MAVGFHRRTEREQNRYIEGEIQAWRHDFNLTEAQASRIRVIEQSFYASNIILPQPAHTGAEMKEHYLKVAAEMRTEDRERFLEMENSAHPQQF